MEGLIDGSWTKLAEGTTIGYKRLLRFDDVAPEKIRVTIIETRFSANIKEIGAYHAASFSDEGILNETEGKESEKVTKEPS